MQRKLEGSTGLCTCETKGTQHLIEKKFIIIRKLSCTLKGKSKAQGATNYCQSTPSFVLMLMMEMMMKLMMTMMVLE